MSPFDRTTPTSEPRQAVHRMCLTAAVVAGLVATTSSASAMNKCKPSAAKPHPVIVVHGQSGNVAGMSGVVGALEHAGYCVWGRDYGFVPGGANGQDRLGASAHQIGGVVDEVLKKTGASQVDFVSHSAGTGVVDNYLQQKGGATKTHRVVSFAGLHHPYAHVGLSKVIDAQLYLPQLISIARLVLPGIRANDIVRRALDLYADVGQPLGVVDRALVATMESNFTGDLFDPDYWAGQQGGPSEGLTGLIRIGQGERGMKTNDASPTVCYTNLVAAADLLVGAATGFQDDNVNIDNVLLATPITANAHNDILGDGAALAKMVGSLSEPCTPAPVFNMLAADSNVAPPQTADEAAAMADFKASMKSGYELVITEGSCAVGRPTRTSSSAGGLFGLALACAAMIRSRAKPWRR